VVTLVFEDIRRVRRRRLFALMGVPWEATPHAWVSLLIAAALGVLVAGLDSPGRAPAAIALTGIGYGALLHLAEVVHTIGHTVSGRAVGSPMAANVLTATVHSNEYASSSEPVPGHVHIGRALGGPLANMAVGLVVVGLSVWIDSHWLRFFSLANLAVGVAALLPIPTLDGSVIWRELLRLKRK
jgi:Zn-dependent protease